MKIKRNLQYGLKGIGGTDGCKFRISYAGNCVDGWKKYYYDELKLKAPYQKWFSNPIFHNRSGYSGFCGGYRVWFIFMWHIVDFTIKKKK